jgi:hypothetical protein
MRQRSPRQPPAEVRAALAFAVTVRMLALALLILSCKLG